MKEKTSELITFDILTKAAECLRLLAHPVRLRIVQLLMNERYTVGDIAQICEIQSHMASEHLRLLQHAGLLNSQREGRKVFYQIEEPYLCDIMACIQKRFQGN